jgi:hypothetical protein
LSDFDRLLTHGSASRRALDNNCTPPWCEIVARSTLANFARDPSCREREHKRLKLRIFRILDGTEGSDAGHLQWKPAVGSHGGRP